MKFFQGSLFFTICLLSSTGFSLDNNEIVFKPSNGGADVRIGYKGNIFDTAIDIKTNNPSTPTSIKPYLEFFNLLHKANLSSNKDEILALWLPTERDNILQSMDAESMKINSARFMSIKTMKIRAIIEYGSFRICYLELDFGSQGQHIMRFTLSPKEGKLFLTNSLNGDHFYDKISPHLIAGKYAS